MKKSILALAVCVFSTLAVPAQAQNNPIENYGIATQLLQTSSNLQRDMYEGCTQALTALGQQSPNLTVIRNRMIASANTFTALTARMRNSFQQMNTKARNGLALFGGDVQGFITAFQRIEDAATDFANASKASQNDMIAACNGMQSRLGFIQWPTD
jgi:hypothetical protein